MVGVEDGAVEVVPRDVLVSRALQGREFGDGPVFDELHEGHQDVGIRIRSTFIVAVFRFRGIVFRET